jgi:hypothetical protein
VQSTSHCRLFNDNRFERVQRTWTDPSTGGHSAGKFGHGQIIGWQTGRSHRANWTNDVEWCRIPGRSSTVYVAIVCGELDIAAFLLSMKVGSNQQTIPTQKIDSIVSSPNGRQEKINILELMGAVNFYFYETHPAPQNGLMYWRAAMHLRRSMVNNRTYSTYLKFGNARENLMGKGFFSRRSQKSNFHRIATNFFFAVAILGSIKLKKKFIFPIKGRVGLKWIPKFGLNTL